MKREAAEAEAKDSRRAEGAAAGKTAVASRTMLGRAQCPVLQASRDAPSIAEFAFAEVLPVTASPVPEKQKSKVSVPERNNVLGI